MQCSITTQAAPITRPPEHLRSLATQPATYNTADGFSALNNNTADNNTAIGFEALISNTNGSDNTAMGYQALASNATDAIDNTAVGSGALFKQYQRWLQYGDRF